MTCAPSPGPQKQRIQETNKTEKSSKYRNNSTKLPEAPWLTTGARVGGRVEAVSELVRSLVPVELGCAFVAQALGALVSHLSSEFPSLRDHG